MAEALISTLSEKLTTMLAGKIFEGVSMLTNFREDVEFICDELDSIKSLLNDTTGQRSNSNSSSVTTWLHKVQDCLHRAVDIVEECEPRKFGNPFFRYRMGRRIKKLKESTMTIRSGARNLKYLRSVLDVNAQLHALNANSEDKRERSTALLTEYKTVGMKKDIELMTDWLLEKRSPGSPVILEERSPVIAVVGMGGLGKTLLVQRVVNNEDVQQHFNHVIWLSVGQEFRVKNLLLEMASQIKLPMTDDLSELEAEMLRVIVREHLAGKCSLFVLDDVWAEGVLESVGLPLESGNDKIVITTRDRRVGEAIGAHHTQEMECLNKEDSWELFKIHAFPERAGQSTPTKALIGVARGIVESCSGLPLAIKTVAASMARVKRIPTLWRSTFQRLNQARTITSSVMSSLRLSYQALPYHLKSCFLYCSLFPKSNALRSEYLVYSWMAEGFVSAQEAGDAYDIGLSYIQELADRCLIEVSQVGGDGLIKYFKIHDLFHDLALTESQVETKCLIKPGKELKEIPSIECLGVRRISLVKNDISKISDAIQCPHLRTLLLWNNMDLKSISASFFHNLRYLAVLDLSQTSIKSLPRSICNLTHLKFLNLSRTEILKLPRSLSGLWRLQFLDVSFCKNLRRLHPGIGEHKFMVHLNVKRCRELVSLPAGVAKLSSLQKLKGAVFKSKRTANVLQLADLKKLTLLQHLSLTIDTPSSQEIKDPSPSQASEAPPSSQAIIELEEGTFAGMKKLRTLSLRSISSRLLCLPRDIESIAQGLERVRLHNCLVPRWIFDLQSVMVLVLDGNVPGADYKGLEKIPSLRKLRLSKNKDCVELPGEFGLPNAFPNLEKLVIENFKSLREFPLLKDDAMPRLKYLRIKKCEQVINMPVGLEKLKSLKEVEVEEEDFRKFHWTILRKRQVKIKVIYPVGEKAMSKIKSIGEMRQTNRPPDRREKQTKSIFRSLKQKKLLFPRMKNLLS